MGGMLDGPLPVSTRPSGSIAEGLSPNWVWGKSGMAVVVLASAQVLETGS